MKPSNHSFQNCKPLQNRLNHYREIVIRTWPKSYTFVRFASERSSFMFGRNVKTIEGYLVVNFEVASSSSFRDIKKIISWRRRRTLTIVLSKTAFAFRLRITQCGKFIIWNLQCCLSTWCDGKWKDAIHQHIRSSREARMSSEHWMHHWSPRSRTVEEKRTVSQNWNEHAQLFSWSTASSTSTVEASPYMATKDNHKVNSRRTP